MKGLERNHRHQRHQAERVVTTRFNMATVTIDELRTEICAILKGADLTNLSSKKVRRELEGKFSADFTKRKKEIDNLIMEAMNASEEEEEKKEDTEEPETGDKRNGAAGSSSDSDSFKPVDYEPARKKVKGRKKSRQANSDGGDADAEMAKLLQEEENSTTGRRTRSGRQKNTAKSRGGAKKKVKSEGGGPKKQSAYAVECDLSEALASLMGCDTMRRSDVVKRMWEIVRERDLQDPRNKQFMICDEELMKVFGRRRVRTFGMMKYLSDHIFKPGEKDDL